MAKRRKNKTVTFLIILCLVILSVYGGIKGGEYTAQKLAKPIVGGESALNGAKGGAKTGTDYILSEDDMVKLAAVATEFITAEHMKKNDKLSELVDQDYYNSLLKDLKQLSSGEALVQDINYKELEKDSVELEVAFLKNSREVSETITAKRQNKTWKIAKVSR